EIASAVTQIEKTFIRSADGPHAAPAGEALRGQYSAIKSATGSPKPTSWEKYDIQGNSRRAATTLTRDANSARRAACGRRSRSATPAPTSSTLAKTPSTTASTYVPSMAPLDPATHSTTARTMPNTPSKTVSIAASFIITSMV